MKHNLDTDVDPTPNHAERGGYAVGSMWRNRVTGQCFVCADASDSGAKWVPWGGGSGSAEQPDGLARVAFSGSFDDLDRRPALGAASALGVGTEAGTVAAGDDRRISGALQAKANLRDLDDAEEARRNLGFNDLVLRLLAADDLEGLHTALGLGDVARRSEIGRLQPKSDALTHLAGIKYGTAGTYLMRAETAEDVAKFLGLVVDETVQRRSGVLDALTRMEGSILALLLASGTAAVRGLLELEPGQKYGPPVAWSELRDVLTAFRRDLDALKAAASA
jgi:hypothetical protein